MLGQWLIQWKNGDVDGFTESFMKDVEKSGNEFSDALFGERDINMAARLAELLESEEKGTYFVVVGAGHFVGKD